MTDYIGHLKVFLVLFTLFDINIFKKFNLEQI